MQQIGFIGLGNMGKAIFQGILANEKRSTNESKLTHYHIYGRSNKNTDHLIGNSSVSIYQNEQEVAKNARIIFLAVKPNMMESVLDKIKDEITESTILVSVAAGISIKYMQNRLAHDVKIIRTMPNIPATIGCAMSSITPNDFVTAQELDEVKSLLECIGRVEVIPEYQIHSVIGASGSSPAFVFMFIEAIADGAVKGGLSRQQAYKFAAQTVMGAAKLVLETGKHPAELKDMVCSPAGTTIDGVQVLERNGFRAAVMDAVDATILRSKMMSNED